MVNYTENSNLSQVFCVKRTHRSDTYTISENKYHLNNFFKRGHGGTN